MTQVFPIHLGDTLTPLACIMKYIDVDNVLQSLDLTSNVSGDIKFKMVNKANGVVTIPLTSTGVSFTADTNGFVEFTFSVTQVSKAGIYNGYFIYYDGANYRTFPITTGDLVIEIDSDTESAQDAYSRVLKAGINITVESYLISNFPEIIIIGDSYTSDTGQIKLVITDQYGDPITALGTLDFADATITFIAYRPNDSATIEGTCEFVDDTTETYVLVSLPISETLKGKAEYTYEGRLRFAWTGPSILDDSDDEQKTFKTTPFKFISNP